MKPTIEGAHLLQARKSDEYVDSICEMCSNMGAQQICKIQTLYNPADKFEPRVSTAFIGKVQAKLAERLSESPDRQKLLLMDIKYNFPVRFPFHPSNFAWKGLKFPMYLIYLCLRKF